ncbi:MAG: hypothetical protein LBS34_00350 [Rickettsiales bacterium]|jgi:hypothetical protein|nr:hypothetical protein [Rickettsiales bacterium]
MTEYLINRLITLKDYLNQQSIANTFVYNFDDGDKGEIILNKLLIPNTLSLTYNHSTTSLENNNTTQYKVLQDDYIIGIEVDEQNKLTVPVEERSWIVFGRKKEG